MKNFNVIITNCIILLFTIALHAQQENAEIRPGKYLIQSAANFGIDNGGYWDIPGEPDVLSDGMNLKIWEYENSEGDQVYRVSRRSTADMYNIVPMKNFALGASAINNGCLNGADLRLEKRNNSMGQKFRFRHLGKGVFQIVSKNGLCVTIEDNLSENGKNLIFWEDEPGKLNKWVLLDANTKEPYIPKRGLGSVHYSEIDVPEDTFYVQSAMALVEKFTDNNYNKGFWDTPSSDSLLKHGTRMEINHLQDFGNDRIYVLKKDKKRRLYKFVPKYNLNTAVSVSYNERKNNTPLVLEEGNDDEACWFYFEYVEGNRFKIFNVNGMVVTLADSTFANNTPLVMRQDAPGMQNQWVLQFVRNSKYYSP